jgi:hypothetical protein
MPQATTEASGSRPRRFRLLTVGDHQGGGAVDDAARVPRGHEAVLAERRLEAGQALQGGLRTGMIVLIDAHGLVAAGRHLDGHDLVLEDAARRRGGCRLLAAQRVFVHLLARDAVLAGQVVGGLGHVEAAVRVEEGHHQGVFELALAQREAAAGPAYHVRGLAHVLHATGHGQVGLTQPHHLRDGDERLEPRAAEAIHGERGYFVRQAGLQRDVSGTVDRISRGLQRVPHDHVVDPCGLRARPAERFACGVRAELQGGNVLEGAHVVGHGGSRPAHDHHISLCH